MSEYYAKGVEIPEISRPDIQELVSTIPDKGTLHLAILQRPYLRLISEGIKTVESRFNSKRAAPFGRVAVGDLVLLKEPGKPITDCFSVREVEDIDLAYRPIDEIRMLYSDAICPVDPEAFWRKKAASRYCTLITIGELHSLEPLDVLKKDQRGWVSFSRRAKEPETLF